MAEYRRRNQRAAPTGACGPLGIESEVVRLKKPLGIDPDAPTQERDAWRLAASLADRVEVEVASDLVGYRQQFTSGWVLIVVPESYSPWMQIRVLLEECGHVVLGNLQPDHLLTRGEREAQRRRLYRLDDQREEREVYLFVLAWLIPDVLKWEYDGRFAELAELCHCTVEDVRARWELWK